MAVNISRLMFEEEQKLKKGQSLSSMGELDKILLGSHGGLITRQPNHGKQFQIELTFSMEYMDNIICIYYI